MASKFVAVRSPNSYNTGQRVGRETCFCCFPQTVQQCPPCCGGDRELTAKVLPGVNHHRTPGMTLIGTDHCTACTVLYQWQTQSLQLDFLSLLTTDAPT